jgi:flagellar hook-associated protein 3 FlgL
MQETLSEKYARLANLQVQTATGKRLQKPSDQPADIAKDLNLKSGLAGLNQYKKNIEDSQAWINQTETALVGMSEPLQRLRELAIQAHNDTLTSRERLYIHDETQNITRELLGLVNSTYNGDYLFGGTQSKIPPLDIKSSRGTTADDYANLSMAYFDAGTTPVGGTVQLRNAFDNTPITNILPGSFTLKNGSASYGENIDFRMDYKTGQLTILNPALLQDVSPTPGNANYSTSGFHIAFDYVTRGKDVYGSTVSNQGEINREIEPGIIMKINTSADEVLSNPTTGADLIAALISYGQDLLQNNVTGIGNAIDRIDQVFNSVNSARSRNGALVNRLDATVTRNEESVVNVTDLQSKLEDADMTTVITDYMNAQNIYNAALKSSANIIQQSLVNFL